MSMRCVGNRKVIAGQRKGQQIDLPSINALWHFEATRWIERSPEMAGTLLRRMPTPVLSALVLVLLSAAAPALADKRVALVIGNSAYKNVNQLPNPAKDAASIGEMLKKAGFDCGRRRGGRVLCRARHRDQRHKLCVASRYETRTRHRCRRRSGLA